MDLRERSGSGTDRATPRPRRFELIRNADVTGVSGTGLVADGVAWADGTVALHWHGRLPATSIWHNGIEAVIAVHGHGGASIVRWLDDPAAEADPP